MNQNEQLARWLGWDQNSCGWWCIPGRENNMEGLPNFRTSNEWAGALLTRLGAGVHLLSCKTLKGSPLWACSNNRWSNDPKETYRLLSKWHMEWRDAVVDAALDIIKREGK